MRYYVFHENKQWVRIIETDSAFDARQTVAKALGASPTDFFAIRANLMTPRDMAIYDAAPNK